MDDQRFLELMERYLEDGTDADEQVELCLMIASGRYDAQLEQRVEASLVNRTDHVPMNEERSQTILQKILTNSDKSMVVAMPARRRLLRYVAAASIVLLAGAAIYFGILKRSDKELIAKETPTVMDALPGGDHAVLTLADGRVIVLDSTQGTITRQGEVQVINLHGQLKYEGEAGPGNGQVAYHTVATPRGGQYQLVLADGSKVWLNAASSIRFPTAFFGAERKVELQGEGFFEIVHNSKQPFVVNVNGAEVRDLGTSFNINGYANEETLQLTLVEGLARISSEGQTSLVKPGQQALVTYQNEIKVQEVNVGPFLAWKENKFYFNSMDINTIARQLSRWYDVDVEVRGNITQHFTGIISRKVPASQVFRMLEQTGAVRFRWEGRKVVIE